MSHLPKNPDFVSSDNVEEEEDYMSDAVLAQCIPQDVRPGLKRTYAKTREHEMLKRREALKEEDRRRKKDRRSIKEKEQEQREEGLAKELDHTNKGFAMLQKMGFKAGESLGKKGEGLVEPIPLQVKSDRGGLGREALLREIAEKKTEMFRRRLQQKKSQQISTEEFRAQKSHQKRLAATKSDLYKSQKACRHLDELISVTEPPESWFWPPSSEDLEKEEEEEEEEEVEKPESDPEDQLSCLTTYLRREHLYCIWCGHQFVNKDDLANSCPGDSKQAHEEDSID